MSGFTPTVKYELDFDGDHVVFELRRLKVKHRAQVMRASDKGTALPGDREALLSDSAKAILPECVVSMAGLTIAGQPATDIKTILEEAYFLPLMDKVLAELMRLSLPSEVDAKNSEGPLADASRG